MTENVKAAPMDRLTAMRLCTTWAREVGADMSLLAAAPDGGFVGELGSIAVDFQPSQHVLIARATVKPFASSLTKYTDIMAELHRIEKDEPRSVVNARFELLEGPWDKSGEACLYLRKDFQDAAISDREIVRLFKELGDVAYLWHRTRYIEVAGSVADRRRPRK